MLYGSKTWCAREYEMAILRRNERAMCGVKLITKKNSLELTALLDSKETLDRLVKAKGKRWYGYVLRRDNEDVLSCWK